MSEKIDTSCWCYAINKTVQISGVITGHRQADLLKIIECEEAMCIDRNEPCCLLGKIREGKWP